MMLGTETIKFAERGLLKISNLLVYEDSKYFIKVNEN